MAHSILVGRMKRRIELRVEVWREKGGGKRRRQEERRKAMGIKGLHHVSNIFQQLNLSVYFI